MSEEINLRDRAQKIFYEAKHEPESSVGIDRIQSALREVLLEENRQGIRLAAESYDKGWNQAIEEAAMKVGAEEGYFRLAEDILTLKRIEMERK